MIEDDIVPLYRALRFQISGKLLFPRPRSDAILPKSWFQGCISAGYEK